MYITILVISIILIGLSIAGWWFHTSRHGALKWSFRLDAAITLDESDVTGPPITLKFSGKVPQRIYIQNSTDLVLSARPTFETDKTNELVMIGELPGRATVQPETTIEVELVAAAFDIGGEPKQQQRITKEASSVSFGWVISPRKAGRQKLMLVARWLNEHKKPYDIDSRTFEVEVTQLFGLTISQYRFVQFMGGLIGVLGIIFSSILSFFIK